MENEQLPSQPQTQPKTKRPALIALIAIIVLLVLGAVIWQRNGGFQPAQTGDTSTSTNVYKNDQYNFTFVVPQGDDVRVREDATRQTTYVGLPVDFFASVRDLVKDSKPTSMAFFYASPGLTVDAFKAALVASDPASISIVSTEDVTENDIPMTKIVSTTASGDQKTHYLFTSGGNTIIISVFLQEDDAFAPILASLRRITP